MTFRHFSSLPHHRKCMKMGINTRYDFIRAVVAGHKPLDPYPKSKPKGVKLANDPLATQAYKLKWRRGLIEPSRKWRNHNFGVSLHEPERRSKWINEPEIRESHLRTKRTWRPNPLVKIAEQLPRKLKKMSG